MSRSAPERWPISSRRWVKSGISTRLLTPLRTRSAARAREPDGLGYVTGKRHGEQARHEGGEQEGEEHDAPLVAQDLVDLAATGRQTRVPRTARKRWIGTATETTISFSSLTRTTETEAPFKAAVTSGKSLPLSSPYSF